MIIEMREGTFSYDEREIFKKINISLDAGDFFCLLGPNGCGKTTLIKCLGSMLDLKEGNIYLNGKNISEIPRKQRAADIGYVPQEESMAFPFTVHQIVSIGRSPYIGYFSSPSKYDYHIVDDVLEKVGITHLASKVYNKLSGGEKQLVMIARALAQQPRLLLMDEPTSHLDFSNQTRIMRLASDLAKEGVSILMSTHTPDVVFNYATKAALMYEGSFISVGTPEETLTQENLGRAYNMPVKIYSVIDDRDGSRKIFCQPDNLI